MNSVRKVANAILQYDNQPEFLHYHVCCMHMQGHRMHGYVHLAPPKQVCLVLGSLNPDLSTISRFVN